MDHSQDNHGANINVNMVGIDLAETRAEATATLSMLSEDNTCRDGRGEEIPGLAVYFTHPRPGHRDGYEIVAITCAGYDGKFA